MCTHHQPSRYVMCVSVESEWGHVSAGSRLHGSLPEGQPYTGCADQTWTLLHYTHLPQGEWLCVFEWCVCVCAFVRIQEGECVYNPLISLSITRVNQGGLCIVWSDLQRCVCMCLSDFPLLISWWGPSICPVTVPVFKCQSPCVTRPPPTLLMEPPGSPLTLSFSESHLSSQQRHTQTHTHIGYYKPLWGLFLTYRHVPHYTSKGSFT